MTVTCWEENPWDSALSEPQELNYMVKMSCSHTQTERERNRQTEEEKKVTITMIIYKETQIKFDGQPNTH